MVMLGDMALLEKDIDIACGHYLDALVPFNSQYTQDASGHVAFRLVGVLLAQNHANHAVRLLAHAASKLVPIRASDLPYGFMLYMSLGYLYLDQDIYQEYVAALKLQLPETFDTLWNEGYQLMHTDGIGYIKSVVEAGCCAWLGSEGVRSLRSGRESGRCAWLGSEGVRSLRSGRESDDACRMAGLSPNGAVYDSEAR